VPVKKFSWEQVVEAAEKVFDNVTVSKAEDYRIIIGNLGEAELIGNVKTGIFMASFKFGTHPKIVVETIRALERELGVVIMNIEIHEYKFDDEGRYKSTVYNTQAKEYFLEMLKKVHAKEFELEALMDAYLAKLRPVTSC
jgi:transcription termination factor NusB